MTHRVRRESPVRTANRVIVGTAIGLVASGAACAPAAPARAPAATAAPVDELRALSDEELRIFVTPRLRPGETLAYEALRGPLGPSSEAVLVIVDRGGRAAGFVLVPGWREPRIDLPPLSEGLLERVTAVLRADANGEPGEEVIIMTRQMTGAGPEGAIPRAFNLVIAWNGSAFVRLSEIEDALLDLGTEAEIREALDGRIRRVGEPAADAASALGGRGLVLRGTVAR